jgi:hypothetical protein
MGTLCPDVVSTSALAYGSLRLLPAAGLSLQQRQRGNTHQLEADMKGGKLVMIVGRVLANSCTATAVTSSSPCC